MKFGILLMGLFFLMSIMIEKSICSKEREKGDVNAFRKIMQSILDKPTYLSLDHAKRQQILIAFFRILTNPDKYGDVMVNRF